MYFRPPVCAVCPYYDVLVLKTHTGTHMELGSVAYYTFYSSPPASSILTVFLDLFIYLLYPTSPPSVAFTIVSPLSCTRSPPPLISQNAVHLDVLPTHNPPDYAAQLCAPPHVPAPATVSCVCLIPLCRPRHAKRYL